MYIHMLVNVLLRIEALAAYRALERLLAFRHMLEEVHLEMRLSEKPRVACLALKRLLTRMSPLVLLKKCWPVVRFPTVTQIPFHSTLRNDDVSHVRRGRSVSFYRGE